MYCPVCGVQSTQGLNFCKRCGANLAAPTDPPDDSPESPVKTIRVAGVFWAIAAFGMGSIFSLMGAVIALAALGADEKAIAATAFFGSAGIAVIVGLFLRYASQYMKLTQKAEPARRKAIDKSPPLQIDSPPRAASVTEHTTRNFDPIPAEREARDRQ
ncbi:MAG: hypothetical protein AB1631_22795 [Acidobacteriota bacterium]